MCWCAHAVARELAGVVDAASEQLDVALWQARAKDGRALAGKLAALGRLLGAGQGLGAQLGACRASGTGQTAVATDYDPKLAADDAADLQDPAPDFGFDADAFVRQWPGPAPVPAKATIFPPFPVVLFEVAPSWR